MGRMPSWYRSSTAASKSVFPGKKWYRLPLFTFAVCSTSAMLVEL